MNVIWALLLGWGITKVKNVHLFSCILKNILEKRRKVGIVLENCDRWLLVITVYWLEFVTALYTALG